MTKTGLNTRTKLFLAVLASLLLGACSDESERAGPAPEQAPAATPTAESPPAPVAQGPGIVFVHLFEWRWPDIAAECEDFLGPNGYAAVQISPPQEHITGPQWWTRYQPVSYRLESRSGTRDEFADMVRRCAAAGVDIYADVVTNHMADIGSGTGVGGSKYTDYNYPVPYTRDDFHHCGRNGDERIENYQDLWEVQTCNLGRLPDLDTGKRGVQEKIAAYMNDLLNLGVAGFRLDAAKHIAHQEIGQILALLDSNPFIFQEVIDRGDEPINAMDYLEYGNVTEFKYPAVLYAAFAGDQLELLSGLGSGTGFLPGDKVVVFVDNHDSQRGHAGNLNFRDGDLYELANVFMLGFPYGYPKVMSSYRFEDREQGPPAIRPVTGGVCGEAWVCEHRSTAIMNMVEFRAVTHGAAVTNWRSFDGKVISFGREDRGHLVINNSTDTVDGTFVTSMLPGEYCNVIWGGSIENGCNGAVVLVDAGGVLQISLAPESAVVIHSGSML